MISNLSQDQISGILNANDNAVVSRIREIISTVNQLTDGASNKRSRQVAASGLLSLTDDEVLMIDTAGGDVDIALPDTSGLPADGRIYEYWIHHADNNNRCRVIPAGGFSDGVTHIDVPYSRTVHVGAMNGLPWMRISDFDSVLQAGRIAPWASTNFPAPGAPIPMDVVDRSDNDSVLDLDLGGDPTRLLVNKKGDLCIGFSLEVIDTNPLAPPPYFVEGAILKNGVAVPRLARTFGTYPSLPSGGSLIPTHIQVNPGDYIQIRLQHSGFTGALTSATFSASMEI